MKKFIALIAAGLGIAWVVKNKQGSAKPADPWADASDSV